MTDIPIFFGKTNNGMALRFFLSAARPESTSFRSTNRGKRVGNPNASSKRSKRR